MINNVIFDFNQIANNKKPPKVQRLKAVSVVSQFMLYAAWIVR